MQQINKGDLMMEVIRLREEYIKLGQALKAAGFVDSGVEAKFAIQDGLVKVNGEVEYQRGKKLHGGDIVSFQGEEIKIEK
jgi:ribosome-associated protein